MSGWNDSILSQNPYFPNMKHKPQKLPSLSAVRFTAFFAVTGLLTGSFAPLPAQDDVTPTAIPDISSTSAVMEFQALDVLKSVRDRLESLQYLECDLYEMVHLSDLRFYAVGRYAQASENRVRLEFRIFPIRGMRKGDDASLKLDGEPQDTGRQKPSGELTQISDGNALWSYWVNGDSKRLTRRNIQEILKAAAEAENFERSQMFEDLGAGGLQSLIARLQLGMEFGKVRPQSIGNSRLLVVTGRWTAESLEKYFNIKDPEAPRPNWMPDFVRVYVDADARLPRRIQYLKRHPDPETKKIRALVTLDFRGMTVSDTFDESQFQFEVPAGQPELDETETTIELIQQADTRQTGASIGADSESAPAVDSEDSAETGGT